MIEDGRLREYIFSGSTSAEKTIGMVGSDCDLHVPGWTSGRAVGWFLACSTGSAKSLRWSKGDAFAAASGSALANYEVLPAGAGVADEVLHAGSSNQQIRIGPAEAGTTVYQGRVVVRI